MAKRSDFKRVERDYYPTPETAVIPLIAHLNGTTFIEPCAGDYRLVQHIQRLSQLRCSGAYDIEPQSDFVTKADIFDTEFADVEMFITNPPWDRKLLHPIIDKLATIAPTWLLFDADWAHTKQSTEYIKYCKKIVSVGRVKWIEDSKMTGKDNCAWYLFDKTHTGATEFVGR